MKTKTLRNTLIIAGSMLGLFVVAGRHKPVDATLSKKSFSENLDADLRASENQFDDITPGAEKLIVWADSSKRKTPYAIVYIHGFSATRQETAPLSDLLAKKWGANLFYTRLTGHGRPGAAMAEASVNDWLNDADEALEIGRRIGEKVIVIGTSTGGTLATWLVTREDAADIAAVVLISPNYWVQGAGAGAMLWPWGEQILYLIQGEYYAWEPANELHGKYWTIRYPSIALVEMMKLLDYVNHLDFDGIKTPALFIYSPNDKVVMPDEIVAAYEQFGSSKKHIEAIPAVEDQSNHVLAGDILSPSSTDPIAEIIDSFLH